MTAPCPRRSNRLSLLVVEDDPGMSFAIGLMLDALEHRCVRVGSVRAAVHRAGQRSFDVLLTDIDLPDGRGWDVLATLAERGWLPPRVITMSADSFDEVASRSVSSGCEAHLEKPFLLDDLERVITLRSGLRYTRLSAQQTDRLPARGRWSLEAHHGPWHSSPGSFTALRWQSCAKKRFFATTGLPAA